MLRPEPWPSPSPSIADQQTRGGGGARRFARRRSRSRPDASPRPRARTPRRSPSSATWASASHTIRCSTARRSALTASSSAAISCARCASLGQQQLEPGIGAPQPPGGVDARSQPEAERVGVERARVDAARRVISARSPGRAVLASAARPSRTSRRFSPRSGTRSATVASATSSSVVARRCCAPQRLRELVRDRGAAQIGAWVAARRRDGRSRSRAAAVGARRVVVGDDDIDAGRARRGDLLDRGDPAVDGDEQIGAARGEPRDVAAEMP